MATIKGGERAKAAIAQLLRKLGQPGQLRVGFLEGATYPDGTTVAMVAAAQNFGTRRIPKRPFFTNMVADKQDGWAPALLACLKASDNDPIKALSLMGEGIEGQLKQSILDTNSPPLAPATIARKGFEKPLVDTSHMLNSTGWEVKS